ncbi:hypothetical protein CAPTEDRAFT_219705 [Capitella teleta]|uniref:Uncharacterized protein n=1 Tax=Capitella teleta TaxID=283909 RepID=R7UBF9_CAPTE|nr:hypothetical protein CAPTEDRAFT_219705 [Capitella teleta]|eukprot:ELU01143.1 hypothetical protein CAPTEDRAFT_219705 [Capitella teleta]
MLSYASSDFLSGSHLQLHLPSPPKGGTISDELRDSMDSRVTQLEAENDLLKENLNDTERRLDDTQRHLTKLQAETQQEFEKKMSELELQTKELRRKTSKELSKEFESKVLEIEQRSLRLKERVAQEFQSRVGQLEERNQQLQLQNEESSRQLQMMQAAVGRGKEQSARTEKMSRDLVDEREHYKEQLRLLKESHAEKVRSLERQVDAMRNKAEEMEKMALVTPLNQSFQSDNGAPVESPARISYVNDSPQKQRSKCSKENCKKRVARPRSSSSVSQDGRPVALQRHASVIGIPTEPSRVQRGKEFEHHHHHFHHHHYEREPCRSAPSTPVKAPLHSFNRNDRLRSSVQMKPPRTPTDHQPFVRNGPQRATMPERRRVIQSAPQTLERPSKGMVLNSDVKKYPTNGMEQTMHQRTQYFTDTDSGCATSPDHSASPDSNGNNDHCFEVFTSETIQMQMRYTGSNNGKWKAFVDKIVELQNRNQHLLLENAEMRRTLKSVRGTTDQLDLMESKNLKLEVENRKLRRICDSLQMSLTGKSQYDKRLYHFYSNV